MKVALLNTLYAPNVLGGTERVVQTLADTLLARGHEPVVICTDNQRGVRREVVAGVPVYYVGLQNVYPLVPIEARSALAKPIWHTVDTANIGMARALGKILDRERPAILHTHNLAGFSALAWSAAHERSIPIVHTLHDYYLLCLRSTMFTDGAVCERQHATCAVFSWPRIKLSARVAAVVGVSNFVLDRHLSYGAFPRAQTFVIGNPCVFNADSSESIESPDVSGESTLSPKPLRIGFLGRLEPAKGIGQLLSAVGELASDNWELHVGGRGTRQTECRLRARFTDPRIHFHGFVQRNDFLDKIDVLVVPSLSHETFGLVAIEAFSAGVPVIASRRGGLPEVVTDGVTGALFDPGHPEALRQVLARFVAEPSLAHTMRGCCLARARTFEATAIAAQYETIYDRVVSI
jgi:glycosyltransferase involved in cell wall biosynthesis